MLWLRNKEIKFLVRALLTKVLQEFGACLRSSIQNDTEKLDLLKNI